MAWQLVLVLIGLGLLALGADALVRGGAALAARLGLPPLAIGLTVVAFGTSTPELVVSLGGALKGSGDLAIGNIVGSNSFNIGLILGLAAMITPLRIKPGLIRFDVPLLIGVSLLGGWLGTWRVIPRAAGAALLVLLTAYIVLTLRLARRPEDADVNREFADALPAPVTRLPRALALVGAGLGLLVVGADLMVDAAIVLARRAGISEAIVGLTLCAAGTSLPELATTLSASHRRQADIAVGNIIGSNLFNILGILGATALAAPLRTPGIRPLDLWVMIGLAVMLWPLLRTGRMLQRHEGALLLCTYITYLWLRWP